MFNRDEPDREKQVHVTVKASDHGKPPLEDVCTIAVKIKDINDNAPIPSEFLARFKTGETTSPTPSNPEPKSESNP